MTVSTPKPSPGYCRYTAVGYVPVAQNLTSYIFSLPFVRDLMEVLRFCSLLVQGVVKIKTILLGYCESRSSIIGFNLRQMLIDITVSLKILSPYKVLAVNL